MLSKERVQRAFHFRKPDKVPSAPSNLKADFFPIFPSPPRSWQPTEYPPHIKIGSERLGGFFFKRFVYSWDDNIREQMGSQKKWWEQPYDAINEWGVIWRASGTKSDDKTFGHPVHGPFQDNWENLDEYTIPDASNPERYKLIRSKIWKFLGRKKYTIGSIGVNGFFNLCTQLRGFNELLVDFGRNSQKIQQLIELVLPFYLIQIEKLKEYYPVLDSIMLADDMGTQKSPFFSPRIFKKFFKEPYKEIISLSHDLGMDFILHSCGQIYELMPEIIDSGVDVFEFDSPHMTGVESFKGFAKEGEVAFWLSSNIQTTFVNGTPDDVEEEIKYFIKEIGNNEGGLAIYEYGDKAAIQVPKENVLAQREAVSKWGNYNKKGEIEWLS
jgi:uroporphyrinogen-III decarboxylase